MIEKPKLSAADVLKFLKSKGISAEAVVRFKKQSRRLTSKQVERALVANKREKLKELCHRVAAVGHAHLYLSIAGDKIVLTGVDQLKSNPRPFNKRGFGSVKHPLTPNEAAKGRGGKKKPYLARLDPEKRREIARQGGLASAKKRKHKDEMRKKRGLHWTQKPENQDRVKSLLAKATAANKAKKASKTTTAGA